METTAKDKIIQVLLKHRHVAAHEFDIFYFNDNNAPIQSSPNALASRLPEMRYGYQYRDKVYFLDARTREGKKYLEWYIDRIEEPRQRIEIAENQVCKTQMVLF